MTRVLLSAVAMVAALSGCATPAKDISFNPQTGTGVVAIPANTNTWPSYNKNEALALIQRHVGPDYEIVEEGEVVRGQSTVNNQQVQSEQVPSRNMPFGTAEKQTVNNTTTTRDITEYHIAYRRKPSTQTMGGPLPGMQGNVQQTQYLPGTGANGAANVRPAGGIVPNVGPGGGNVIPAGGAQFQQPQPQHGFNQQQFNN